MDFIHYESCQGTRVSIVPAPCLDTHAVFKFTPLSCILKELLKNEDNELVAENWTEEVE